MNIENNLFNNPINQDSLSEVFEIENNIRQSLVKDNLLDQEKHQNLYDQQVIPLVNRAKQFLRERPFQFAVQAAAAKGKALQAGLQAIQSLTKGQ